MHISDTSRRATRRTRGTRPPFDGDRCHRVRRDEARAIDHHPHARRSLARACAARLNERVPRVARGVVVPAVARKWPPRDALGAERGRDVEPDEERRRRGFRAFVFVFVFDSVFVIVIVVVVDSSSLSARRRRQQRARDPPLVDAFDDPPPRVAREEAFEVGPDDQGAAHHLAPIAPPDELIELQVRETRARAESLRERRFAAPGVADQGNARVRHSKTGPTAAVCHPCVTLRHL